MDRAAFRRMFLQVDQPIVEDLLRLLADFTGGEPAERREEIRQLCHRIRGDARSVGFSEIGDLAFSIEQMLRSPHREVFDEVELAFLRAASEELWRRMTEGEGACADPLPVHLSSFPPPGEEEER